MATSTTNPGWRLVHDGVKVIMLDYFAGGRTRTQHTIFEGTEAECRAEITNLGLIDLPIPPDTKEQDLAKIKAVYQDLIAGTGTAGERMTRVENATARLIKERFRVN